ncbi:TetR/AcrR family transcriptional regulator [Vibrio diazotrophicus]|uniref:TetR/AcrR family transcriptional regulator n=1 Tax=Vibrio diazotrophicus TaxID=685 RepID=UPI000C9E31F2|nr:TetR/AcrR family transcriptional regulator [Vibrio diazotrophicus]PNH79082.1 TetR family transcriptional regulator [Vibrio diazotrophicus]
MNEKSHDTKQHILDIGYELIASKGFTGVGLSELLKNAEVPKGSFYHYFKSKEQFGEALLQDYFNHYQQKLENLFANSDMSEYEKLMQYWRYWMEQNSSACQTGKCLVVKLAGEVSDLSEPMRLALHKGTDRVISTVAEYIEKGIQSGEINVKDSRQTSELLYNLWIGASLINKIRLDDASLVQALKVTEQVLKGEQLN